MAKSLAKIEILKEKLVFLKKLEAEKISPGKIHAEDANFPFKSILNSSDSLGEALRKIIPSDYSMLSNDQSKIKSTFTSINSGKNWKDAAEYLVSLNGGSFKIDHINKRVFVSMN